jgi:hypothetical protein
MSSTSAGVRLVEGDLLMLLDTGNSQARHSTPAIEPLPPDHPFW